MMELLPLAFHLVLIASSPKGVEHYLSAEHSRIRARAVLIASSPKGVEHKSQIRFHQVQMES